MLHEENHGRMLDHQVHQEDTAKLKELDSLGTQYSELVEYVTKMFDWSDVEDQNKQLQNDKDVEKKDMDVDKEIRKLTIDQEKEKLENDKMKEEFENLIIDDKELKCITISKGEIIRNTRKERDEIKP
ncbi:putative polyprotein [Hordeum vulgare]|nr:putative polyprotein [Hordeum vulgare]